MSAFIGRVKNKASIRRNKKAYEFFKELIANQDKDLLEKLKENKIEK